MSGAIGRLFRKLLRRMESPNIFPGTLIGKSSPNPSPSEEFRPGKAIGELRLASSWMDKHKPNLLSSSNSRREKLIIASQSDGETESMRGGCEACQGTRLAKWYATSNRRKMKPVIASNLDREIQDTRNGRKVQPGTIPAKLKYLFSKSVLEKRGEAILSELQLYSFIGSYNGFKSEFLQI
ncbi:hypothetical protein NPIL_74071 [Nephila pilipes]|uniref:Uncharacterized protein n=1 Tax=Nephila pilipes TaxID=299642 RepID=A0A8X6P8Y8_NEPPI|nr:hypothetical protein NPIL_74071 [Nephila pilipes]